ncbi:DUF2147 domain-containing protein [Kordiimonas aquimaris]|uniref:DUF2147 domain-containing protein n=1 Tax=Kordiimonas aquimaris TaxID=707591 RepID=UPI0021D119A0|nr:DUF2147 domain-containing protein [Kordiimonas aquimaris]
MMRHLTLLLFAVCTSITLAWNASANDADAYNGFFWNQTKDAIFEIRLTENTGSPSVEGITRWSEKPAIDTKNPDPALKERSLKGVVFLWGFKYDARKNRWKNGKVYDPNNGKTYDAKMELEENGNILKMRGYIGISLLGRTAKFERVKPDDFPAQFKQ